MSPRRRVHLLLSTSHAASGAAFTLPRLIAVLILLNVVALVLESEPDLAARYGRGFFWLEAVSVAIFTLEYLLRLWSCVENPELRGNALTARLRWATSLLALVDLAAILPFYLPMFLPMDLRALRILRLLRIARVFKMGRYSESVRLFAGVFRARRRELTVSAALTATLLVMASSLMYGFEHDAQPEVFSSIPATMWWGVVTLTTVGYGDAIPVTWPGRVLSGLVAVLGVGLFAIPAGILASGFSEAMRREAAGRRCPHCGEELGD